ncbi:MAG: amidophosphoribosyltransferase [Achromobacter sp.]|nr:amidophosphoribosyltransferase [Achromobacter sp.]
MTNRTQRLKASLFAQPREISLERALLYTASHRQTEGEPVIIRRAKATAWILDKVMISIRDDELIAGNRTVKPRAGIMSPEMDPYWLLNELDAFPTRPQDRFAISEEDKQIYRETLYPYWEKRSMKDFINGQMTEEVKAAVNTQIFSVNQTDKGQGHIIIDYPRLLNHGLGALVAELKTHCARQPENPFYQAVLILLEASQRHILRYAALAEEMAGHCQDPQRQQELLTIAAISRHNAQHRPTDFPQACQLFWYMNIILQYESNASSISLGRFDQYMLPFYQASLNQGQDPAYLKELLESLWVKCNDIVLLRSSSSARYFAGFPTGYTALLGGLTDTGRSAVNVLSFLCLDAYQNVQLPQPNLGVRVNELVDRPFLRKTAETIRLGTGIPQIFNDEVVIPAFLNRGVSLDDDAIFRAVSALHKRVRGAYAVVAQISGYGLLAFRDPNGIRPLCIGRQETEEGVEWMVASESVALEGSGFAFVRDVEPGEAVFIDLDGRFVSRQCAENPQLVPCIFEYVYFARPDSLIDGVSVYDARLRMGEYLADKVARNMRLGDIDVVMPIPDSSRPAAMQLAARLNLDYREGLIKNRYVGRTFIMPGQAVRRKSVRQKLNAIGMEFKGKNVLLVDDSIVRGTTSREIVDMARAAGANKVYFASAAPPVRFPNVYGIDMPTQSELIATGRSDEEIARAIGADNLVYQDLHDMQQSVRDINPKLSRFEASCFDGEYVTGDITAEYLARLGQSRSEPGQEGGASGLQFNMGYAANDA